TVYDTLIAANACEQSSTVLTGSGGNPDFYVTGTDFGVIERGFTSAAQRVIVHSTSSLGSLAIDSMYVEDSIHFVPVATAAPNNYWINRAADSVTLSPTRRDLPVYFSF